MNSFGNLDQILTEFNGFEIFNTDTTEEKIVMKKFALWFCWENLVWSANEERPLSP